MPLLSRKRVLLARIESTYGTDPVPTGASHAVLVRNMDVTPQENDLVARDLIRPYLGNSEQIPAGTRARVSFEVEMAGAGTAGTAAPWSALIRACGFAESLVAANVTGTAQAGAASTITLHAGASAVDNFYRNQIIRLTGGTGSGQRRQIIAYSGSTKVATVAPAWATTPNATSTFQIDAGAYYSPISGPSISSFPSVTLYFNVDGVLHRLTGARGTVSISMEAKQIPVFRFEFTGIYNAVTDTAAPTPVYTAWQTPLAVTNINTTPFQFHTVNAVMSSLSIDLANSIVHRTLVGGSESVLLTDREPAGNIVVEAETVAFRDWWSTARNVVLSNLDVTHGLNAGNIVQVYSGAVQVTNPSYSDMDGVQMLNMGLVLSPPTGDDEIVICAK